MTYNNQQIETKTLAVQKNVQEKIQQQIQEATFVISNPINTVELAVAEEKMPYHLVAGAYRSEENAKKENRIPIILLNWEFIFNCLK